MNKVKIQIKTTDKELEYEVDLDELALKAQKKELTTDDIQLLFNYLLNK